MRLSCVRCCVSAALALLVPAAVASAQGVEGGVELGGGQSGGEGSEPLDLSQELDYSESGDGEFDEEAWSEAQGVIQVGKTAKGKGYSTSMYGGSVVLGAGVEGGETIVSSTVPETYVVQPGDTLLGIASAFFGNPDIWPEIWSLNPEITNPNWIYPGQQLMLVKEVEAGGAGAGPLEGVAPQILVEAKWKPGTVFYRNPGFIDKEIEEASGKIIGSFHEVGYLSYLNQVYIKYEEGKAPSVGATATVYRIEKEVKAPGNKKKVHGKLVRILGTVKVTEVDEEHKIATALVTESLDVIKRKDLVGPVRWKLASVEPVPGALDLDGKVIASLDPVDNLGEGHVVFVDIGYEDGVIEGNKLFVMQKGDKYQKVIGKKDLDPDLPWEDVGEIVVLEALKKTSTCLLVNSSWDVAVGDRVELRRGI